MVTRQSIHLLKFTLIRDYTLSIFPKEFPEELIISFYRGMSAKMRELHRSVLKPDLYFLSLIVFKTLVSAWNFVFC